MSKPATVHLGYEVGTGAAHPISCATCDSAVRRGAGGARKDNVLRMLEENGAVERTRTSTGCPASTSS